MHKSDLTWHIRLFIPKGWVGPIHEFDYPPLISDEDFEMIKAGKIPIDKQYDKWYVVDAIKSWWIKNGVKNELGIS